MEKLLSFRPRGREVTRLEGFSDAVFGFAATLLVVSLEVPRSYDALMASLRGFVPFAACFALLIWMWSIHNGYFRRYTMQGGLTTTINAILLFVILFFVLLGMIGAGWGIHRGRKRNALLAQLDNEERSQTPAALEA